MDNIDKDALKRHRIAAAERLLSAAKSEVVTEPDRRSLRVKKALTSVIEAFGVRFSAKVNL